MTSAWQFRGTSHDCYWVPIACLQYKTRFPETSRIIRLWIEGTPTLTIAACSYDSVKSHSGLRLPVCPHLTTTSTPHHCWGYELGIVPRSSRHFSLSDNAGHPNRESWVWARLGKVQHDYANMRESIQSSWEIGRHSNRV